MTAAHIRRAGPSDLSALERIETLCFPPARRGNRRVLRRSLRSPAQSVWLALRGAAEGRETTGAMVLYHYPRSIRVFSLAVTPAFRGQGTGRCLLRHAVALARRAGLDAVTLEADRSDRRLVAWYERFGFKVCRDLADYYSPGGHAVRMRLPRRVAQQGGSARERP